MADDDWITFEATGGPSTPAPAVAAAPVAAPTRAPAAAPVAPSDGWITFEATDKPSYPTMSAYEAAGGGTTWTGDIYHGLGVGMHGLGASFAGAAAATTSDPEMKQYYQDLAAQQLWRQQQSERAQTPGARQPGFSHPVIWAAEQAPMAAAFVGAEAAGSLAAGPVGAAAVPGMLLGTTSVGDLENRMAAQGQEPTALEKLGAAGAGVAAGAIPGLGLTGKIASGAAVRRVLGAGEGSITWGGFGSGEEAIGEHGEIRTGQREGYDPSAITSAGVAQGIFGGVLGGLHGRGTGGEEAAPGAKAIEQHTDQTGGEFTSTRSGKGDARKPEATTVTPGVTPGERAGPAPPASPVQDPDIALAASGKAAVPTTSLVKPPERPLAAPPAAEEGVAATTLPAKAGGPPAASLEAPRGIPSEGLMAQHAEMLDKSHPRRAVSFSPDVEPPALTKTQKLRYGSTPLPDGSTLQYDRTPKGLPRTSSNIIQGHIDNGTIDAYKQELLRTPEAEAPAPVTPVAAEAPAAEPTPTPGVAAAPAAPAPVAEVARAEPAPTPAAVPAGEVTPRVTPSEQPRVPATVVPAGAAEAAVAEPRRVLEAAQTEREKAIMGQAALKEKARQKAESKAVAAREKAAVAAEEGAGGKHRTKAELESIEKSNAAADKIMADHPKPDGESLPAMHQRARDMVQAAKDAGVKIPKEIDQHHSPGTMLLAEARALTEKKVPTVTQSTRFFDREAMLRGGEAKEAIAVRRAEGKEATGAQGAPEGAVEAGRPEEAEHAPATPEEELIRKQEEEKEPHDDWAVAADASRGDVLRKIEAAKATARDQNIGEPERQAARLGIERLQRALTGREESVEDRMAARRAESEQMRQKEPAVAAFGVKKGPEVVTVKRRSVKKEEMEGAPETVTIKRPYHYDDSVDVHPTETITASEALQRHHDLAGYSSELRPTTKILTDRLLQAGGDTPVHMLDNDEMQKAYGNVRGVYDPKLDRIFLNNQYLRPDTPLHELFHAVTHAALTKDPQLKGLMDKLHGEVMEQAKSIEGLPRSLRDPEEFLTNLMTKPEVQEALKRMRISDALAKEIGIPKWRKATMWNGVLDTIRRALGLPPRATSAIEAAMAISELATHRKLPAERLMFAERYGMADLQARMREAPLFQRIDPADMGQLSREPEESGEGLGRSVKGTADKIASAVRTGIVDKTPAVIKGWMKSASEPQLYDTHKGLFHEEGMSNPMRDRLDAIQRRAGRADELSEPGHKLAVELRQLASEHGPEAAAKLEEVKKLAHEFKVWPHQELGEGKNSHLRLKPGKATSEAAMKNWEARAQHPAITKAWKEVPEPMQDYFLREAKHYTDTYDMLAEQKGRSYIEGVEPPPGSSKEDIVQRMLNNKLTDADRDHYESKGIKNLDADDFQKSKGPYFPPERNGDFVVTAEHDIPTPKGSDRNLDGSALPNDTMRRFDTRDEAEAYVSKLKLPSRVSTQYYMVDPQGNRVYKIPGTDRKITSEEATTQRGWSNPKQEFLVNVQNKHVSFHRTMSDAQAAKAALEKDGLKNISQVQDRRGRDMDASFTSAQTRAILSNIDRRTDLTDEQKTQMKDLVRETATVSQSGNRIAKNFAKTQRVQGAGYTGDGLTKYSQAASRYIAAAEAAPKIDAAIERMRTIEKARNQDDDGYLRSVVLKEAMKRSYNTRMDSLYPQFSPTMQHVMNAAFVQDMASVSHLLTHQLNLHFMGASVIGARHGVFQTLRKFYSIMREAGGPWMAIKQGFGTAATHMFKDPEADGVSMFDMMRNSVKEFRRRAVVDELVASQHIHKDSGLDLPPIGESRGAVQKVSRFIRDASGAMDTMGRVVTGLAAYDFEYAKLSHLPLEERHATAIQYARESIEKGLIHYGAGMRAPALSGPMMRMISQFRLPGTNMLYLLARNAYLAFRSADKATRNEAYKTLGTMMLGGWALSGTSALPTEPLKLLFILGNQFGITPAPSQINDTFRRYLANEFSPTVADVILDGPLSLLGPYAPSFAHRVASPEMTFGEPRGSKPEEGMAWLSQFMFGAAGSMGVNVARGAQAAFGGNYEDAFRYMLPKQLADAVKAHKLYEEGKADAPMALMQTFGVRSQTTVRQQEGESALYERLQQEKKDKGTAVKAAAEGDRSAMLKWNAANPQNKITLQELQQARMPSKKVLGLKIPTREKALGAEYERAYQ